MFLHKCFKLALCCSLVVLVGCVSTPPSNQDNLCAIFKEKRGWYKDAAKASKRWGVPIGINMAFIHQESRFVANAKPPRKRILWIFPGPRKSSSFGYSQAKKESWRWYQKSTGRWGADRNDFDDAIDFVAWYNQITIKKNKVKPTDAYALYLAYHEGHGGFSRRTFDKKAWIKKVATKVSSRAKRYQSQLKTCEKSLQKSWWPF